MTNTGLVQSFSQIEPNVLGLETSVTSQICEGLNRALASFQLLYLQYQKHHFTVQGAEFYSLHEFFEESYGAVKDHAHDLGERLNGLGSVPVAHPLKLVELSCFAIEDDGVFNCRTMLEHDLAAEQAILTLLRRLTAQAESLGDRATRYLLEGILLKSEERAYHIAHFLAPDSLKLA